MLKSLRPDVIYQRLKLNFQYLREVRDCPVPGFVEGRKNILFMISSLNRGGAQRVAVRAANELADDCNVFLLYKHIRGARYESDERVHVIRMPKFRYDVLSIFSCIYLRRLKRHLRIDTAVSMLHNMNGLNVLTKGSERVIVSERNNPKKSRPRLYPMTHLIYAMADHVIFRTREVQSMYSRRTQSHSSILPNPVSVSCLAQDERKQRIVNAARLHPNKNQAMLIRAFARFLTDHPAYTLSLYGEGDLNEELRSLAASLGISDKVIFHGNVPDIHEQMADAGMFVLTSNVEGMPNALLEAMMMGLPCITTDCTGAKELIEDGVNGLQIPMNDESALVAAMTRMADHPEEAERMRKNAMQRVEPFRVENAMKPWRDLILGA